VKMLGRQEGEIPNLDVVRDRLLIPSSVTSKGSEYPAEGIEHVLTPSFQNFAREVIFSNENYRTRGMETNNYTSKTIILHDFYPLIKKTKYILFKI